MNAFRRGHAITGLEELAFIISQHLVLLTAFPENQAARHWLAEVDAFEGTLRRWDKGKKGARNYTPEIVKDALLQILEDEDQQELLEGAVEAKGLNIEAIDWDKAVQAAQEFSRKVCK
jgi:hypothetical protein